MRRLIIAATLVLFDATAAAGQSSAPAEASTEDWEEAGELDLSADMDDNAGAAYGRTKGDPWEPFNRQMFKLNDALDRVAFRPLALGYVRYVPKPLRQGLHNFYGNLGDVPIFVNDVLQLEPKQAGETAGRLAVNTTLGVGGILDVASGMGLRRHDNDFGITLGRAGVGSGPYLFLPLMGPTNVRDLPARLVDDIAFDPLVSVRGDSYWALWGTGIVTQGLDRRAAADDELTSLRRTSLDPYVSIRSTYEQNRQSFISGGELPLEAFPDFPELDEEGPPPEGQPPSPDVFPDFPELDEESPPADEAPPPSESTPPDPAP